MGSILRWMNYAAINSALIPIDRKIGNAVIPHKLFVGGNLPIGLCGIPTTMLLEGIQHDQ
jgi:hypothetical protein